MKKSEILEIYEQFPDEQTRIKYLAAKRKVREMRGFYIHLLIYILVMGTSIVTKLYKNELQDLDDFLAAILWGIVILIHAGSIFLPNFFLGKDWEEKKVRQYMEESQK